MVPFSPLSPCRAALVAASLLAVGVLLAGCVPPSRTSSPAASYIYVASPADGTIARLERHTGRLAGPPLSVGGAPAQLVAGPGGSSLALGLNGFRNHIRRFPVV